MYMNGKTVTCVCVLWCSHDQPFAAVFRSLIQSIDMGSLPENNKTSTQEKCEYRVYLGSIQF